MWFKEKKRILEMSADERPNDEFLMLYFRNAVTLTKHHTPVLQYGSSTYT